LRDQTRQSLFVLYYQYPHHRCIIAALQQICPPVIPFL
jgi:hypothetical protein